VVRIKIQNAATQTKSALSVTLIMTCIWNALGYTVEQDTEVLTGFNNAFSIQVRLHVSAC